MRNFLFALLLAMPAFAMCQMGVYMSAEDYLKGKLTDECEYLLLQGNTLVLKNGKTVVKKYDIQEVWGFRKIKDDLQHDYRIIQNFVGLIELKGEIYYYGDKDDYFRIVGKDTVVVKSNAYPYVSKGAEGYPEMIGSAKAIATFLGISFEQLKASPCWDALWFNIFDCWNKKQKKKN